MRKAFAILTLVMTALCGATAVAASSPKLELAAWVRSNTDLAVSQIAIAGPENVYSLEPLGPRLPTGEILALVRTEAVSPEWRAAHQFQSWDAHMLFDCQGGRVRVLRSASYTERDRTGRAKADERGDAAFSPQAGTPAATLLAAACEPTFNWPLRGSPASAPSKATPLGGPSMLQTASMPRAPTATAVTPMQIQTAVQIERAPAVRLADVRSNERLFLPMIVTPAAEPRREKAASPEMPQFASDVAAAGVSVQLQKASFTSASAAEIVASSPPQALADRHRAGIVATAIAATRSWKRLAVAGRGWLAQRVELAFGQGEPPHSAAGSMPQTRAS